MVAGVRLSRWVMSPDGAGSGAGGGHEVAREIRPDGSSVTDTGNSGHTMVALRGGSAARSFGPRRARLLAFASRDAVGETACDASGCRSAGAACMAYLVRFSSGGEVTSVGWAVRYDRAHVGFVDFRTGFAFPPRTRECDEYSISRC